MKYIIASGFILLPILIGVIYAVQKIIQTNGLLAFSTGYLQKFSEYMNSQGRNMDAYTFLTMNGNKMQNMLGRQGLVTIREPYVGIHSNLPIIINGLSRINQYFGEFFLERDRNQYANMIQEAILREIGDLENMKTDMIKVLKNPLKLLQIGYSNILSAPVYIISSVGIISGSFARRIISSFLFKLLAGVITLIGLASGVVTLVAEFNTVLSIFSSSQTFINGLFHT